MLRQGQSVTMFGGDMGDSQLVQEITHKNNQVEILHGQIKTYADNLDKERRRNEMLTLDNQSLQHQLQLLQVPPPVPPRSPSHVSDNHSLLEDMVFISVLFYLLLAWH